MAIEFKAQSLHLVRKVEVRTDSLLKQTHVSFTGFPGTEEQSRNVIQLTRCQIFLQIHYIIHNLANDCKMFNSWFNPSEIEEPLVPGTHCSRTPLEHARHSLVFSFQNLSGCPDSWVAEVADVLVGIFCRLDTFPIEL